MSIRWHLYNDDRFKQTHDISEGSRVAVAVRRGLLKLQPGFSASWRTAIIIRHIAYLCRQSIFMVNIIATAFIKDSFISANNEKQASICYILSV